MFIVLQFIAMLCVPAVGMAEWSFGKFSGSAAVMTTTASITNVSQVVLQPNQNRTGLIIYNNSSNSVYIAFDTSANSGNHMTLIIPTFTQWVMPMPVYAGAISAIRNSGSGVLMITELTP